MKELDKKELMEVDGGGLISEAILILAEKIRDYFKKDKE